MISIEQLIVPATEDEVFEKLLVALTQLGIQARQWRPGGVARSILGVVAQLGYQGSQRIAALVAGNFLALASGGYLTTHAEDVYGVIRIPATFATGQVTLTNTAGGIYNAAAGDLVVRVGDAGPRFRITDAVALGSLGSVTVSITAIAAGAASTVLPGDINRFETPFGSGKVTVTNAASIVGTDAESDDALRARCLVKKGTWSPFGPRDAYEYAALSATLPGGSPTSINRVAVSPYSSTGVVTVTCATPSGTPSSDELAAVTASVEQFARAAAATAVIQGAVPKSTAKSIRIWSRGGVPSTLIANASAAVTAMLSTYRIGGLTKDTAQGYLYDDKLIATIIGSSSSIYDADIISGAGDLTLATNEVAVNTLTFEARVQ